jgi:type I restriction enzyme, S subunit
MKGYPKVSVSKLGSLKKGGAILREKLRPDGAAVCLYGDIYTKYAEVVTSFISRVEPSAVADGVRINTGDVVFAGSGETAEEIGKCIAYVGNEEAYAGGDVVILSSHGQDARYLGYVLNAEDAVRQKMRLGQGSSVMHLYKDDVGSIKIPLPPLAEQRKIAEILRTWDEAIETAEAELKAKQERKSWLMQKLLTCPNQLEGTLNKNAWSTVSLEDVASFQNGEAFSSRYFNSDKRGLRLIRNRDLKNDDQIIFYDGEYSAKDVVSDGDLLVGMDGDFTPVIWRKGKALLNQRVGRVSVKPGTFQTYIYYALYSALAELEHVTSATTVKHLSSKGCLALKISLPDFDTQSIIAGILEGADADIEVINHRIETLRAQKCGLMQKLLTGEVRVAA